MRLTLDQEHQDLVAMLRTVFTDVSSAGTPWRGLADAGIFALPVPTAHGGDGGGLFELGLVFAEAGRVLCPTAVYQTLAFAVAIDRLGMAGPAHLPRLARGDLTATVSLCDAANAVDVEPRLTATRCAEGWLLNGRLDFVGDADGAEVLLTTARSGSGPLAVLADLRSDGVVVRPTRTFAGDDRSTVLFTDQLVDETTPVTLEALTGVSLALTALQCMEMVGGATAVLNQTVGYVTVREQFGRPLSAFQAVRHHVADMRIALDGARLCAYQALWLAGRGGDARRPVAIAKLRCAETYKKITWTAHQLHGGMGFVRESPLHRWSERAKVTEILGGTADTAATWLTT